MLNIKENHDYQWIKMNRKRVKVRRNEQKNVKFKKKKSFAR